MQVVWTWAALDGIEQAYDYLAGHNPRAVRRVADGLRAVGYSLAQFPHRGRRVPGTDMRELVTSFSYIIRYRITGETVELLRIRHSSRRPTVP